MEKKGVRKYSVIIKIGNDQSIKNFVKYRTNNIDNFLKFMKEDFMKEDQAKNLTGNIIAFSHGYTINKVKSMVIGERLNTNEIQTGLNNDQDPYTTWSGNTHVFKSEYANGKLLEIDGSSEEKKKEGIERLLYYPYAYRYRAAKFLPEDVYISTQNKQFSILNYLEKTISLHPDSLRSNIGKITLDPNGNPYMSQTIIQSAEGGGKRKRRTAKRRGKKTRKNKRRTQRYKRKHFAKN